MIITTDDTPRHRGFLYAFGRAEHKTIGLLTISTAFVLLLAMGTLALFMRAQLARPNQHLLSPALYNQFFTIHGSGMIFLVITPFAIGLGVYLVPLQVGAPVIAAARATLFGYWLYLVGAITLLSGFLTSSGAASAGWFAYAPLSDSVYSPGKGMELWILGSFLAAVGMILMAATTLWTALRLRAPGMTMLRLPVFTWTMVITALMVIASFPSLLAALTLLSIGRFHPSLFQGAWNIGYQNLFWFYGHPVVYVMFFPFVGAVAEVVCAFSGRGFFGYKATVLSLLLFGALSMSVWGHHMFTTGQSANNYYSLTSTLLSIPAGLEYFGLIGTLIGGRIVYKTPMLFALAFLPQFLIGGLTGIMLGTPALDNHFEDSYFVVAHFHYTLFAGSAFGLFAGLYYWFPKMSGWLYNEKLGVAHFVVATIGTNLTFLPMFGLGMLGMPRRVATYPANAGFTTLNTISSIGAGILAISILILLWNIFISVRRKIPAGDNPWSAHGLEWATGSPPPRLNFDEGHPLPYVASRTPLAEKEGV